MSKAIFCVLLLNIIIQLEAENVKINELFYDPIGADSDYEWIEFYNPTSQTINLENWQLESAGTSFESIFTFSQIEIEPQAYLLIGEALVPNCHIYTTLSFQNGGSATDGVRIISPSGYTDTILYDAPNSNNLPSDQNNPGIYFSPDVSDGNSLARYQDGVDSDNCAEDWFESAQPTPNAANFYPIDLEMAAIEIYQDGDIHYLSTQISNLSTQTVDNCEAELQIWLDSSELTSLDLPAIEAESQLDFQLELGQFSEGYYLIDAMVNFKYDSNIENNSVTSGFLVGDSPIIINEVLYKDSDSTTEWIEIFNRGASAYLVDNFMIVDAAGGEIPLAGEIAAGGFLVFCQGGNSFSSTYPQVDPQYFSEAASWTVLNNGTESLSLCDVYGTVFDFLAYEGYDCPVDYSIELNNPYHSTTAEWLISTAEQGATPTVANSVLLLEYDLGLQVVDYQFNETEFSHLLKIENLGLHHISEAEFSCWYAEEKIVQESVTVADSLLLEFTSSIPPDGYYQIKYQIDAEADMNSNNNSAYRFYNSNSLPFVINEIMYDPIEAEPEWLEIKFNQQEAHLEQLMVVVREDTVLVEVEPTEYLLIVPNSADSLFLAEKYDLDLPITVGLPSLVNSTSELSLFDNSGNIIEIFSYFSEWNQASKGSSIERVNPLLPAQTRNWAVSVAGSTPGRENSIYTPTPPNQKKLEISPNPFSPRQGEHTIISFNLPDIISLCTLRLYDLKGRLQRKIVDQQFYASSNQLVFDGKKDNGKILPSGIYIVLLEAVTENDKKVIRLQDTLVIAQ